MLGTVLEKIQALLPKRFWLAGIAPVLLLGILNGSLLYDQHDGFRAFANANLMDTGTTGEFLRKGTLLTIVVLLVSFVSLLLNTRLREIMEGNHWWGWLRDPFVRRQREALRKLESDRDEFNSGRWEIRDLKQGWKTLLQEARKTSPAQPILTSYEAKNEARKHLRELERARNRRLVIRPEEFDDALLELEASLTRAQFPQASVAIVATPEATLRQLDSDQVTLLELLDYAEERMEAEVIDLHNRRQFNYPDRFLAPTSMGNIARSVSSYARGRYGLDVDSFWTRFQKVMEADPFYETVQDAKTQLDALVSTYCLLLVSTVAWFIYHFRAGYDLAHFAGVAVGGPIFLWLLYQLCLQSYRAFADLLRGSVDLYRFQLLKALHVPLPEHTSEEKALWDTLNRGLRYGENQVLTYKHE
jgi:hypothetical protein